MFFVETFFHLCSYVKPSHPVSRVSHDEPDLHAFPGAEVAVPVLAGEAPGDPRPAHLPHHALHPVHGGVEAEQDGPLGDRLVDRAQGDEPRPLPGRLILYGDTLL